MVVGRTDWEVARVVSDRFNLMVPESMLTSPKNTNDVGANV